MTIGAILFMQDRVSGKVADSLDPSMIPFGRALILMSLLMDGVTAYLQVLFVLGRLCLICATPLFTCRI
jgi:hypothetical protein